MELPKDSFILLSFVNTKLRDDFASLEDFCTVYQVHREQLCHRMEQIHYHYDETRNQFV